MGQWLEKKGPGTQAAGSLLEKVFIGSLLLVILICQGVLPLPPKAFAGDDLVVYGDALAGGWQDWSYNGAKINYTAADPVYTGDHSISIGFEQAWSGFQIGYSGDFLDVSAHDTFGFRIHGGQTGGQSVELILEFDQGRMVRSLSPSAGSWTGIEIPLSELSSPKAYSIQLFNASGRAQPEFFIDAMGFKGQGKPEGFPNLSIDAARDLHAISPHIYGMNFASADVAAAVRLPVRRWGGNSTSRYNWKLDVHNTGSDWFFENIPNAPGRIHSIINQDLNTGAKTILTMPLMGWTPKRRMENHPYDCGFRVSLYGPQDSVDPWDTDCGNGMQAGLPVTGNDSGDTSQAITPAFVTDWISSLTGTFGKASAGGVRFYSLDNEPMLWNHTHRDVHPASVTYDEIRDRTYAYASAIKAADAGALTLGPVAWGWCAYFFSAADGCAAGSDHAAHGGMDFAPWYLAQMRNYEQIHGFRILDYLDLHIYPQVSGVFSDSLGNASVQAARLRSTRQLWDRTYVHEGWINQPVYLIPRMKAWVADHYPGTRLAITEYNWGALGHMNGALAQADILGIFGREGLDLATLWSPPDLGDPGTFAFRMYRNYDGFGNGFGDLSVFAGSSDQDKVSIYAAIRSRDRALTAIFVNKTQERQVCPVALSNFEPAGPAQVFQYSGANPAAIDRLSDLATDPHGFEIELPANAITLVVISPAIMSGCPADMEPDGDVDTDDLKVLAGGFGQIGLEHDIDKDRDMDGRDLYEMVVDFGRMDCFP